MHIEVTDLAPAVREALKQVRYGARDIEVIAAESVDAATSANDGARGFITTLNLDTGQSRSATGDFGGRGLGHRESDWTNDTVTIPEHGIVIKGSIGYPRTFARIFAHPAAFSVLGLPSGEPDGLSDVDQQALYCFAAIKGGEYRRDEMRRRSVTADVVDGLVSRGYLKRNKAGATQITTKGKNARTVRH